MKVYVVKRLGRREVGQLIDLADFVANDLIVKGFVSETNPIASVEEVTETVVEETTEVIEETNPIASVESQVKKVNNKKNKK